ncbi:MAG TPA: hypothetical protein VF286_10905 [Acidiphilium sp.]
MKRLSAAQNAVVVAALIAARGDGSRRAWAKANGLAEAYVRAVETGRQPPSERLLRAAGLEVMQELVEIGGEK